MKMQTAQFWAGVFADEAAFSAFIREDPAYYAEDNEDGDLPLSAFARSQGARWYDHDFMEAGFSAEASSDIAGMFKGHSYVADWAGEFGRRLSAAGLTACNAFVLVGIDAQRDGSLHRQIDAPCSTEGDGFRLVYLGEISFPI